MSGSSTPPIAFGTALAVSTYMLEELGTPGAGISYWQSDSEADPPTVPLTVVAQSGADSFAPADVAGIENAAGHGFASLGGSDFGNALQQLGHAIGLANPGAYDSGQSSGDYLPGTVFQTDTGQYTVMSDNDAALTGANLTVDGTSYAASTPMPYDIYAVQRLYGSPHIDPSGSSTFGFNVSPGLPTPYDFTENAHPVLTIYSHTANNTLTFRVSPATPRSTSAPARSAASRA